MSPMDFILQTIRPFGQKSMKGGFLPQLPPQQGGDALHPGTPRPPPWTPEGSPHRDAFLLGVRG